jgi:hypothetical protein
MDRLKALARWANPTPKWWATSLTAAGTIVTLAWAGDGINTDDEKALVIGIVVQRLVAWAVPSQGT